jgi:hypothetical protein
MAVDPGHEQVFRDLEVQGESVPTYLVHCPS